MDLSSVQLDESIELSSFTNKDAYELGSFIARKAIKKQYSIVVRIERNSQTIFQYANDKTSINNEEWIEKKMNVVKRFNHSSAFIDFKLQAQGVTFEKRYGDSQDYAPTPGAMPIRVKNVGVVAYIGVSGLDSNSDHQLIMDGLHYLKEKEEQE